MALGVVPHEWLSHAFDLTLAGPDLDGVVTVNSALLHYTEDEVAVQV